jgi:uncharacterized protein YndB with AHSA1/START domain
MRTKDQPAARLQITRILRAPLQRIYAAWTDPALLRQWWGPDDVTTHELIFDPKVGGQFFWSLSDSDGTPVVVRGEIFDLVLRERIGFTWLPEGRDWPHPSRVTVDLRELRGVEVRITHSGLPDTRAIHRHKEGWTAALANLERVIVGSSSQIATTPKPRQTYTLKQRPSPISTRNGTRGLHKP